MGGGAEGMIYIGPYRVRCFSPEREFVPATTPVLQSVRTQLLRFKFTESQNHESDSRMRGFSPVKMP